MDDQNKNIPLVSLGLVTYNRAHYLPKLLDCLLSQNFKDFELIISDDASTDHTQQICEEYARKDKRIIYIRQKKNLNAPTCFKVALSYARGIYFAWVQDDDLYDEHFLSECMDVYRKHPELIMVFAGMVDIDKNGKVIKHIDPATYIPLKGDMYERLKTWLLFRFGSGKQQLFCGLWRREVILDDTLFGPNAKDDLPPYYWGFDNFFIFRNLARGRIGFVPQILFFRRSRVLDDSPVPPRWIVPRLAVTFYHRFHHAFVSPYFRYITRYIISNRGFSYGEKIKLIFWNFYAMSRLFFVRSF